jgi:hypothetical protein
MPDVSTFNVTFPAPVPDAALDVSHAAFSEIIQLRVPAPVFKIVRFCALGLLPPCWAVKDKLVGLAPIAGLTGTTGAAGVEGVVVSCANPGISAANLLIDRPPALPLPDDEELFAPAAARGMAPVDVVPVAMVPEVVADDGATLMVARGTADPTALLSDNGSVD